MSPGPQRWLRHVRELLEPSAPEQSDAALLARFARSRDEAAFAALVDRHGGMVLGVCQRVLGSRTVAEDCAQATFILLAQKAAGLRRPEGLAGWLYGTAYRLACRQRRGDLRRCRREASVARVAKPPGGDPLDELTARELVTVIDEELQRLPQEYRLPLILCALEGLSQEEAAARLGWSVGSVRGRLERGRARLKARLEGRGLSLSIVLGAATLSTVRMPGETASVLVRAAVEYAAGNSGSLSPAVLAFVKEELRLMSSWKLKAVLVFLAMTGAFGAGAGWLMNSSQRGNPLGEARTEAAAAEKPAQQKEQQRDARAERIAKVKDGVRKLERNWEEEDEVLLAKIVKMKLELVDLEEELQAAQDRKPSREIEAQMDRVTDLERQRRILEAQLRENNPNIAAVEKELQEAREQLADLQKKAGSVTDVRRTVRREIVSKEDALRRLEAKRSDRREQYLRQRDDLADRVRQLENDETNEPSDRALRGIERKLEAIQRELAEVKRELRKAQESAKKR
jgi:RNA polymerase sigma factor (sigma-70 family)